MKIVEISSVLAGPAVGMFFAELGATVIKVENSTTAGDMTRKWKLPTENESSTVSAYCSSVNYKKQYLSIDFNNQSQRKSIDPLLTSADIVIVNFKKGDDIKFNLTFTELNKINPALIYAHITGYGKEEDKTAFDIVLQAEAGYMYMNGTESSGPVKMPVALIDILAAHQLKEAILLALLKRNETKKGGYVHVSLYETAIASLANQASNYLMENAIAKPMGTLHPNIAPYGEIIRSKEGVEVVLAVGNDAHFKGLCKALNSIELFSDQQFLTNHLRIDNRSELVLRLNHASKRFSIRELEKNLLDHKVPHGLINNMQQVFLNPMAKKMVLEEEIQGKKTKRVSTIAFNKGFLHD